MQATERTVLLERFSIVLLTLLLFLDKQHQQQQRSLLDCVDPTFVLLEISRKKQTICIRFPGNRIARNR